MLKYLIFFLFSIFIQNSKGDKNREELARKWLKEFQPAGRPTIYRGLKRNIKDESVRCIPVCGIVGVGKSSLVRRLYYKAIVKPSFKMFGWVDVPSPFNLRDLSRNLLLGLHSGSLQRASMLRIKDPVQECRGLLQHNRCLIVINGLQSTEEWDSIKADLVGQSHESLIVVTAHDENVAGYCFSETLWDVNSLEFEEALDLFKITVSSLVLLVRQSHAPAWASMLLCIQCMKTIF